MVAARAHPGGDMPADPRAPRVIAFDRRKYGRYLLADAAAAESLPGFIASHEPHRLTFYEIALIEGGRGQVELDGEPLDVHAHRVIVTTPGEARRWRLAQPRLHASLAFFEADALDELLRGVPLDCAFPCLAASRSRRAFTLTGAPFARLHDLAGSLRDEIAGLRADSGRLLGAQLYHLLVLLQRHCAGTPGGRADAQDALTRRFVRLVDARFASWPRLAQYAEVLHVSRRHLNACVRRTTGRTASALIHDRLVLEAQRRLLATRAPVCAIAEELGFSDTSYFVRFFRLRTGATPAAFRRERGSPIVDRESH